MENFGQMSGVIHGRVHTLKYNHMRGTHRTGTINIPDCYTAFHLYSVEWTPTAIIWYVDDKEYFRFTKESANRDVRPFDVPFSLIISLSLGGGFGGRIDDSILPAQLILEYMRVYKLPDFLL